ncbi:hypothetical protein KSP40_PGU002776 [Platanthera guangdongensis]|uniref:Pectinesterase catalytic domain-containing protein n=1 Tax=Platanthera guangdongensis TaxID=2320717 RepID=A0ABR2M4T6_9ASPA
MRRTRIRCGLCTYSAFSKHPGGNRAVRVELTAAFAVWIGKPRRLLSWRGRSCGIRAASTQFPAAWKISPSRRLLTGGFPKWIKAAKRRLLQATTLTADVTVAKDGSRNYTTVMEGMTATSIESARRFMIYVKSWIYVVIVEMKKKWNLMIVGDGMNQTIISGESLRIHPLLYCLPSPTRDC